MTDLPRSRSRRPAGGPRPISIGLRHLGYPQDGRLRWVRWIDEVETAGGGTGTPFVHVLLSTLPEDADPSRPPTVGEALLTGGERADAVVQVHPGDMPALSPGQLVRDGKRVGWLKLEERTLCFDTGQASDPTACRAGSPAARPKFWSDEIPWTVLPESAYPLGGFDHGRCVVVHDGQKQLVLPCSEVFRFFFAPETLTANALLSGPFELVLNRLINPEWTGQRDDGSHQVGLRAGLTGRSAASLANLANGGRAAANRLFRLLRKGADTMHDPGGAGRIEAGIPYAWTRMRIRVRGLQLYPDLQARGVLDKFLGLVIVDVAWPVPPAGMPPHVHYRLDNNNSEHPDGPPPDPTLSAGTRGRPVAAPDGGLEETAAEPPGIGSEPTFLEVPAAVIEGGPTVSRMPLEAGGPSRRTRRIRAIEPVPTVSSGTPQPGSTGAATLRHEEGEPAAEAGPSRFAALVAALDGAVGRPSADGGIESWEPVAPGEAQRSWREGLPVWPFPARDLETGTALRWCNLFPGIYRARTALVVAISTQGHTVHWLEIELRAEERGYRSVVFTTAGPAAAAVPSLLLAIAGAGGKEPPAGALAALPGVLTAVRRRHGPRDDPFKGRRVLDGVLEAAASPSAERRPNGG